MEALFKEFASYIALLAELAAVVTITIGMAEAAVRTVVVIVNGSVSRTEVKRDVWSSFARWIMLALEFALAADIVRTAIAPTWNDIGQLAAIAVIRTGLNFFLEKDFEVFGPKDSTPS